jgi:hypothetical protein
MIICEDSPANGRGSIDFIIVSDILGESRTSPPDLGAYQNKICED